MIRQTYQAIPDNQIPDQTRICQSKFQTCEEVSYLIRPSYHESTNEFDHQVLAPTLDMN
jgi:hypothetical protein